MQVAKGGRGSSGMTATSDDVVAKRMFKLKTGGSLIATLYRPYRIRAHEWAAPFAVKGLPEEYRSRALGADGLQALLLAAQALRNWLERSGLEFAWLGGETGYTGIPRTIADSFGLEFSKYAEQLITKELTAHVQRNMAARRKASKRATPRAKTKAKP